MLVIIGPALKQAMKKWGYIYIREVEARKQSMELDISMKKKCGGVRLGKTIGIVLLLVIFGLIVFYVVSNDHDNDNWLI